MLAKLPQLARLNAPLLAQFFGAVGLRFGVALSLRLPFQFNPGQFVGIKSGQVEVEIQFI